MATTTKTKTAIRFFRQNAGWSYHQATQTKEQGRRECARALARAERIASRKGFSFQWELDDITSRDWTDEGEETPKWLCICRDEAGQVVGSLGGVDFGNSEPWGQPYRRVVQAEIAFEAFN